MEEQALLQRRERQDVSQVRMPLLQLFNLLLGQTQQGQVGRSASADRRQGRMLDQALQDLKPAARQILDLLRTEERARP